MIDEIVVRNLGVIEEARIEPGEGLTVITGETGTGKTLLLGALRLLLGGDSRPELIGPFGDEAVAEGRFLDGEGIEVGAARRLPRDGRSRAYLDGSIASARALDERVAYLVDIVGQHDHLSLTRPGEARILVDRVLDEDGKARREEYRRAWEAHREALSARDRLGGDRAALARELDLVTFQSDEIAAADFSPGDDVELEQLGQRLRHADEIVALLSEALDHANAGRDSVGESVASVRRAARLDSTLDGLAGSLTSAVDTLSELGQQVRVTAEGIDQDPQRLEVVEARLTELGELRRKYGRSLEDVLAFGEESARRRQELEALLERADVIDEEVAATESAIRVAGDSLRDARARAGGSLAEAARTHLQDLGFDDPVVTVDVSPSAAGPAGADSVALLFASDSRLTPRPVAEVASGGELSRLVLALRLAGGRGESQTLVFDEIDAGIGGGTALAMGRKLADLAEDRQVLCVTHLPQVAAFADRHYVVHREGTTGAVTRVEGGERVEELARMLAGLPESDRGRQAAEELLDMAAAG